MLKPNAPPREGQVRRRSRLVIVVATVLPLTRGAAQCPNGTPVSLCSARPAQPATAPTTVAAPNVKILISDVSAAPSDSIAARVATDALRMHIERAALARVMTPVEVSLALRRMRRDSSERVTPELARQIAVRAGVAAVVDASLTRSASGYVLTTRLVSVDSGRLLTVVTSTARNARDLITATDTTGRRLRATAGAMLATVHAPPNVAPATTKSFEALQKYSIGVRAHDGERDFPKSITYLKQAIALDSTFASAWRKLGVVYANSNLGHPQMIDDALGRAFRLRGSLPDDERLLAEATYYGLIGDRGGSISTYEEMLRKRSNPADSGGFNNLADALLSRREYARSEALSRAYFKSAPNAPSQYGSLIDALIWQRKFRDADSVATVAAARFPAVNSVLRARTTCRIGAARDCDRALDSLHTLGSTQQRIDATELLRDRALLRGQLALAERLRREARQLDSVRQGIDRSGPGDVWDADGIDRWFRHDLTRIPARLDSMKRADGPWTGTAAQFLLSIMAAHYSWAERPDRARAMLAELKSIVPDSEMRQSYLARRRDAEWEIALAERRWADAIVLRKAADMMPDGPRQLCSTCMYYDLGLIHDRAGARDSAIANYERFLTKPDSMPFEWVLPVTHERLCTLSDEGRQPEKAARYCTRFVEMWKDADEELQPRVEAARRRLANVRATPLKMSPSDPIGRSLW
jgi:tetratricopeptide (TPR) repeat protein